MLIPGVALLVSGPVLLAGADDTILEKSAQPSNILSVEPAASREIKDEPAAAIPTPPGPAVPEVAPDPMVPDAQIAPEPPPVPSIPRTGIPDEGPLWEALRHQRYDEVVQRIDALQAEFPDWRPPARLRSLLAAGFRTLLMDSAIRRLQQAAAGQDDSAFDDAIGSVGAEIERRRDAGTAVLVAWRLLQRNDIAGAAHWFEKARTWDASLTDPPYGLALCAMQEQRFATALDLARSLPESHPDRARLLSQSALALAEAARQQGDPGKAVELYREAASYAELPRYGRLGWAWASLQTGDETEAAGAFTSLYAEAADGESAQGLLTSYLALGRETELDALAVAEPLSGLLRTHRAQSVFAQKQFLLARSLAPETYGRLGAPGAPRVTWHSAWRDKSGDPGLSRLKDSIHGAEAVYSLFTSSELRLRVDYHILDGGGFDAGTRSNFTRSLLFGSGAADPQAPDIDAILAAAGNSLRVDGTHGHVGGVEPLLTWRREARYNIEVSLGMTLAGGQAPPRAIGRVTLGGDTKNGNYTAAAFMRPIRDSILSYTGLRLDELLLDTSFTGKRWGAVRGTGVEGSGYHRLGENFSISGRIAAERVDGRNVRSNDHVATTLNLGYALPVPGMDYTVIGASYSYDHYEHNLSQFTPGHGGYFSPQNFWQAKATLDFQSAENRQALIKGHLDGGRAFKREGATPMIPLDGFDNFGTLPGSRTWGWSWGVDLAGAVRVGDHVQVGANFSRRESPQYDETMGMLFLRVMFEPRKSVLSTDLTVAVFEGMR